MILVDTSAWIEYLRATGSIAAAHLRVSRHPVDPSAGDQFVFATIVPCVHNRSRL